MSANASSNISEIARQYFVLYCASLLATFMARGYEAGLGLWNFGPDFFSLSYLWLGFMQDLQISFFLALFLFGAARLLQRWFEADRKYRFLSHAIAACALVQLMLISYFGATHMPLGAEFWGYSITEMANTVIAAEQLTVFAAAGTAAAYILVYVISKRMLRAHSLLSLSPKTMYGSLLGGLVLLVATWVFPPDTLTAAAQEKNSNKLSYFMSRGLATVDLRLFENQPEIKEEYPMMQVANYENDVLGPYFKDFQEPPNVVFLLVESLGGEFVGPSGQWTGFAPFLDSLLQESLYWENGLSLSGRTFGLVPSLLGSLPFGENGFMALGPDYPRHQSLISMLGERGYHTSFYSGYDTYFDGLDMFLEYQGVDFVLNKEKLERALPGAFESNYWGVDDKTMLNFGLALSDTLTRAPRLEIYHTLQSHSPFVVPDEDTYEKEFEKRLEGLEYSEKKKAKFRQYKKEFTSLLFADQALAGFMESYRKKPRFENTIFIITGDHWLIPVPQTTAISRYHVPIIIFSPKLNRAVSFRSVNTHAEIVPSLAAMLEQKAGVDLPGLVHWLGGKMDTTRAFNSSVSVPLMRNKNQISDYLDGHHYLFGDDLFELREGLGLKAIRDTKVGNRMVQKLQQFKAINDYVVENDRLYEGKRKQVNSKYAFLTQYDTLYARLDLLGLSVEEQFQRARHKAFDGQYETARAIAKRILLEAPGYLDVQILVGRTHAWEGNYEEAAGTFKKVLEKDPSYADTYSAYFDSKYWQGDYSRALEIVNNGLKYHTEDKSFLERKFKALSALEQYDEAQSVYEKLEALSPDKTSVPELKSNFK